MKRKITFTSIIALLATTAASGQYFSIERDTSYITGNNLVKVHNNITVPPGSSPCKIQWAIVSSTCPDELMKNIGICDNSICRGNDSLWPTNYITSYYPAGATETFSVEFDMASVPEGGPYFMNVRLRNFGGGGTDTIQTYVITRTPSTAIKNVADEELIEIFPNPALSELNISYESLKNINKIEILNTSGRILRSINCSNKKNIFVNTSEISGGVYIIKLITTDGSSIVRKFFKL